jgi:acetyl esterase/lipase
MSSTSLDENGQGYLLEKDKVQWYFEQYFQVSSLTHDKDEQGSIIATKVVRASPLLGKFSTNMPSTLIITAGCDPVRDEGIAYANSLTEVGVNVKHHSFDGMTHAYMLLDELVQEECLATYQLISEFVELEVDKK